MFEDTLVFIDRFWKENGFAPSMQEICEGVGVASKSTAKRYIDVLKEEGFIVSKLSATRTIRLTSKGIACVKNLGKE